jgi:hypothetical protein
MLNAFQNCEIELIIISISVSLLICGAHAVPPVEKGYGSEKLNAKFFLNFPRQWLHCQIENAQD